MLDFRTVDQRDSVALGELLTVPAEPGRGYQQVDVKQDCQTRCVRCRRVPLDAICAVQAACAMPVCADAIIARINQSPAHTPCDGFWHGTG
jgi:hypothetical protein